MTDADELAGRVTELETRLALQDETIRELSDMVAGQWNRLETLQARIEALQEQNAVSEHESGGAAAERPPPHY
ncbi:MAG: SlyX family protein [Rhodospirillaceae bacterium]